MIANMYNSVNDVIQLNDAESKKLVIKALGDVLVAIKNKYFYPRNKLAQEDRAYKVVYTLNIAARDGRYRMEINYGKINSEISEVGGITISSPYEALVKPTDEDKKEVISSKQIEFKQPLLRINRQKETGVIRWYPC